MINVIYSGLELIGITNIGLSIILFTLVVYLLMTPLQIKQQKFSKLNAVMQPEIQKIQKKYNGKKDQDSMMKQNEEISDFSGFSDLFDKVAQQTSHMNTFLNLNISDTPLAIIKSGMAQGGAAGYLLVFSAAMVPILAWLTQWMNYKLMPQPKQAPNSEPSAMEASMKSMNTFMPIMSAVFCFSFPVGIGIYWVIGAVIRCIQQLVINRKMEQMDMEDLVRRNQEKMKKKMEKRGVSAQQINQQARMNARNIQAPDKTSGLSQEEKAAQRKKATEYYNNANVKPGSLAAKANMVKQFDEKNTKKK